MSHNQERWIKFHETNAEGRGWPSTKDRRNYWWISDHGNVKITYSWKDTVKEVNLYATGGHATSGRYWCISLNTAPEKYVHRLVATYFCPNPENKRTVNHIDGNKSNNHYSNLEWATHAENHQHAAKLRRQENNEH